MQGRSKLCAALTGAVLFMVPASAQAAITATVTGDDGNPVALNAAAPLALRNMDVQVNAHVDQAENGRWSLTIFGPDSVPAATASTCNIVQYTQDVRKFVTFRGNGTYRVIVQHYADAACSTQIKQVEFQYTVTASVAIGQPPGAGLTRQPGSLSTITHALDFAPNPGAVTYEIKYSKGGVIDPATGGISGVAKDAYLNRTTGKIEVSSREPGDYVMVARGRNGDYYTPWSAPVTFKLLAPFDMSSVSAIDSRGPSYRLRGTLNEPYAAGGRVTVAIAKGKNGKKFRTLGRAKVNSKGVWTLRFTVRKRGAYRVRYSYAGNALVVKGAMYESVRISTRLG